jgi:hypothetical protein
MGHGSKIQVSRQIQYDGSTALAQSAVHISKETATARSARPCGLRVPCVEQWLVEDQAKLWGKEKTEEELQLPGLNVDKPYGGSSSFYQDGRTPR